MEYMKNICLISILLITFTWGSQAPFQKFPEALDGIILAYWMPEDKNHLENLQEIKNKEILPLQHLSWPTHIKIESWSQCDLMIRHLGNISKTNQLTIKLAIDTEEAGKKILAILNQTPKLTHLDLSGALVKAPLNTKEQIIKSLANLTQLTELNLSNNQLLYTHAEELQKAVLKMPSLSTLNLHNNFVESLFMTRLQPVIETHPHLQKIDLSANMLDYPGAQLCLNSLCKAKHVIACDLKNNQIMGWNLNVLKKNLPKDSQVQLGEFNLYR